MFIRRGNFIIILMNRFNQFVYSDDQFHPKQQKQQHSQLSNHIQGVKKNDQNSKKYDKNLTNYKDNNISNEQRTMRPTDWPMNKQRLLPWNIVLLNTFFFFFFLLLPKNDKSSDSLNLTSIIKAIGASIGSNISPWIWICFPFFVEFLITQIRTHSSK